MGSLLSGTSRGALTTLSFYPKVTSSLIPESLTSITPALLIKLLFVRYTDQSQKHLSHTHEANLGGDPITISCWPQAKVQPLSWLRRPCEPCLLPACNPSVTTLSSPGFASCHCNTSGPPMCRATLSIPPGSNVCSPFRKQLRQLYSGEPSPAPCPG